MRRTVINLWKQEEYHYPMACGFMPNLHAYLHEESCAVGETGGAGRPCMIIVPGGGYEYAAPAEADPVAERFYKEGFQVFVLTYSADPLKRAPLLEQPMKDLARAVRLVRANAAEYRLNPKKLILCGFSAGAHLCASICVHYDDMDHPENVQSSGRYVPFDAADCAETNPVLKGISCRPDAAFLNYPVITMGEYAHRGSVKSLLGDSPSYDALNYFSLETQVHEGVPPCFIWHTATDDSVPVQNSMLFAMALKKAGVTFAYHIFSHGKHGLSLADEVWARGHFEENYTQEHAACILREIECGDLPASEEEHRKIEYLANRIYNAQDAVPECAVWPDLSMEWLRSIRML